MSCFILEISGALALFTRPEFKVERMSYEVITPSAARAIFEALKNQVKVLQNRTEDKKLKKWMDSQEVLITLNISIRTLQTYRDTGKLPYSQVGQKFFYKPEDVEKLVLMSNQ